MLSALLALGILTAALLVILSNSDDSGKGGGHREPAPVRVRVKEVHIERRSR